MEILVLGAGVIGVAWAPPQPCSRVVSIAAL